MPGNKLLPLSRVPAGAGGKGACGFRAQAPYFPDPAPQRKHGPPPGFRVPPGSRLRGPRTATNPHRFPPFADLLFYGQESGIFPPSLSVSVHRLRRVQAAPYGPHLHGSVLSAVAFNPGEALGLSAGTNA